MSEKSDPRLIERRGRLAAELLFEELGAKFIAQPTGDFAFDLIVGFKNSKGGINITPVEIKATEQFRGSHHVLSLSSYQLFLHTNPMVFLLVVDVKANKSYYAWPSPDLVDGNTLKNSIRVKLTEIDDVSFQSLQHGFQQ